ncbi:MAG: type II and III secretion system protein [Planctomycetes bacterium]|nr:type II and III secretion system protein [Planctomycetota bacterium]
MRSLIAAITVIASSALAADVHAQAVQLPTFRVFGVRTTVSVPDRGSALLGGVSRASSGSVSRGVPIVGKAPGLAPLFGGRAIGSTVGASNVGVTATIIDHRELDAAVLAEARRRRLAEGGAAANMTAGPRYNLVPGSPPAASVAEIRRQHAEEDEAARAEVLGLIENARQAESAGKLATAKIYYRMAARRADETLRRQIEAHLASLEAEPHVAARP